MSSTSPSARVSDVIRDRTARIAVIGQGYVGLPLAVEARGARNATWGIAAPQGRVVRL